MAALQISCLRQKRSFITASSFMSRAMPRAHGPSSRLISSSGKPSHPWTLSTHYQAGSSHWIQRIIIARCIEQVMEVPRGLLSFSDLDVYHLPGFEFMWDVQCGCVDASWSDSRDTCSHTITLSSN